MESPARTLRRVPGRARGGRLGTTLALVALVSGCGAISASAYTVSYEVRPRTLTVGEMGEATFTLNGLGSGPAPAMPELKALRIQPNPARGQNFSMVNGQTTRTLTFTYRFLALEPGEHALAPPPYTAQGETHPITPVTITVAPRSEEDGTASLSDMLFARLTTDRPRVYIQEASEVVLAIYSRNLNLGRDFRLSGVPTSGLSFQEFVELPSQRENLDGVVYDVRRFRSRVRALTAGTFTVEPTVRVSVIVQQRTRRRSIFDMMWDGTQTQAVDLTAPPLEIEVLPLPQDGRPPTFSGAVGSFEFEVQARPLKVQAGEPVTITMQVSGRGNLDSVSAPALDLGSSFKVYEPRLLSKEMNDSQTLGRKTFEQVVIPRSDDVTELPPVAFSFFDPAGETYRTLQQGPFALQVVPSTSQVTRIVQPALSDGGVPREDIVRRDVVYLKKAPGAWRRTPATPWFLHPLFLGLQLVPPLAAFAGILAVRRRQALLADVAKARRLRAPRAARSGLEAAASALERGENAAFYEAVWDTLGSYFADRLNLAPGDVSEARVNEAMKAAGMSDKNLAQLRELFMVCEHARFGLSAEANGKMSDSEERNARLVMDILESVVKGAEKVRFLP